MSTLLQPGYLARITAGVAVMAMLFPEEDRVFYVRRALTVAVASTHLLLEKARSVERGKREGIVHVLERLGVEHASYAASKIPNKLGPNRRSCLERFLEGCEYSTAHQAIQAVAQVGLVEEAVLCCEPARRDSWQAHRLVSGLRALRDSLDTCEKYSGRAQGKAMPAYVSRASDKLTKRLPGLAWCFETGRLTEVCVA